MEEIEAEIASLMEFRDKPAGTIRITLSDHAHDSVVWPKLRPVLVDYPDIKLELNIDNGLRNIVEEGFDAGIRLGESVEKDMIAVRIGPDWRLVAVASRGYLDAHPAPVHPQELIGHNCMNVGTSGRRAHAWEFEKDGQELRVRVDGQLTFNSSYAMIDAALNGYGIAYVPEDIGRAAHRGGQIWFRFWTTGHRFRRILHLLPQSAAEPAGLQGNRRRASSRETMKDAPKGLAGL